VQRSLIAALLKHESRHLESAELLNIWDEIREKIFKNYALKSMDAVRAKLKQAILYIERNPGLVRSITSFPYIINSL
jgi:hypothetical protein